MSRPALPWYRSYSKLYRDEDYVGMTLPQRAVFRALMDYANEQTPRGTFSLKNMRHLANLLADGDEALLQSVLDYCTTDWTCEGGETTNVVIEAGRGRFSQWDTYQRSPSEEPAAVRERQERYKAAHATENNGHITAVKQPDNKAVEEEEEEEEEEERDSLSVEASAVSERTDREGLIIEIIETLSEEPKAGVKRSVSRLVTTFSDEGPDGMLQAADGYIRWQETLPPSKRHKDRVRGYENQLVWRANKRRDGAARSTHAPPKHDTLAERFAEEMKAGPRRIGEPIRYAAG